MPTPSKPLEEMTEAEVRASKDWLLKKGRRPRPFSWARAPQILAGRTFPGRVLAVTDGRAVSALNSDLKVWDFASGRELVTLKGHTAPVSSVAVSGDGKWVVSASLDGTLKVWNVERGSERHTLAGHTGPVNGVALSLDGKWAVSASTDCTLKVWDVERGHERYTLGGHTSWVYGVALSTDGNWAVSASADKTLKVWDVKRGRERNTLAGHTAEVVRVALSADGKWAVSASLDYTLKVWDVESGCERHTAGHTMPVSVAVSAHGECAVLASWDGSLRVWDLASGTWLQTPEGDGLDVVAVNPDGRVVAVSANGTRRVWKPAQPVSESEFDYDPALNTVIERSADGKRYIVGVRNAELQRIQELKDEGKSGFLPRLGELPSR